MTAACRVGSGMSFSNQIRVRRSLSALALYSDTGDLIEALLGAVMSLAKSLRPYHRFILAGSLRDLADRLERPLGETRIKILNR